MRRVSMVSVAVLAVWASGCAFNGDAAPSGDEAPAPSAAPSEHAVPMASLASPQGAHLYVPTDEDYRVAKSIDWSDPALVGAPSGGGHGHRVTDENSVIKGLPDDIKNVYTLAKDAAEIVSTFTTGATVVMGIADLLFGSSSGPDPQIMAALQNLQKEMDQANAAIAAVGWSDRARDIANQVAAGNNAVNDVAQWAKGNPAPGSLPLNYLADVHDSSLAIQTLMQPAYWLRPNNPDQYGGGWPAYIGDRAPIQTGGQVWDFRLVAPALVEALNNRFAIMAVQHPNFTRDASFSLELGQARLTLLNALAQMQQGIVCRAGWKFEEMEPAGVGLPFPTALWGEYAACADIYSGAYSEKLIRSQYQSGMANWYNMPPLDPTSTFTNTWTDQRATLGRAMGLAPLAQMIDVISWYMDPWAPLFINRLAVGTYNKNSTSLEVADYDVTRDDQLWSYDPVINRARSGTSRCFRNGSLGLISDSCGWGDPSYGVQFGDVPPRVIVNGACLTASPMGAPQFADQAVSAFGSTCDPHSSMQAAGWKRLDAGNGQVTGWTAERADVMTIGNFGVTESATWDPAIAPGWKTGPSVPAASLPAGAELTMISRFLPHIDVFAVDNTGAVISTWRDMNVQGGAWQPWFQIMPAGTAPPGAPIASVSKDQYEVDVFVVGNDGGIWTNGWHSNGWTNIWNNSAWGKASRITPPSVAQKGAGIGAVARDAHSIDVFTVTPNGALVTAWWNANLNSGNWSFNPDQKIFPDRTLPATARVATVSRAPGQLDVFAVGNDGAVHTAWANTWNNNGAWSAPFPLPGLGATMATPGASVAVVARTSSNLDVFAVGPGNKVLTTWWWGGPSSPGWSPNHITIMNPGVAGSNIRLSAAARYAHHLDVYAISPGGGVTQTWWDAANSSSAPWSTPGNIGLTDVSIVPIHFGHLL